MEEHGWHRSRDSRGRSRERSSELHYSGRSREESQSPERGRDRSTDRRRRERMDWQDCRDERGQRLKPTSSKESPFDPHEEQSMFRGPDGRNLDMKIAASTKIMIRNNPDIIPAFGCNRLEKAVYGLGNTQYFMLHRRKGEGRRPMFDFDRPQIESQEIFQLPSSGRMKLKIKNKIKIKEEMTELELQIATVAETFLQERNRGRNTIESLVQPHVATLGLPVHPGYEVPLVPSVYTVPPVAPGQVYSNPPPLQVPIYPAPPPSMGPGYPQLPPPGYPPVVSSLYNLPPVVPTPAPVLNPFSLPPPPVVSSVLSSNPGKETAKSRLRTSGSDSTPNLRDRREQPNSAIDPWESRKRTSNHTGPRNFVDPWEARDHSRNGASSNNRQRNRIDPWETRDQPRKGTKSSKIEKNTDPWQSINKQAQSNVSMMRGDRDNQRPFEKTPTHVNPIAKQSVKSSKTAQQLYMPPNKKSDQLVSQKGQKEHTEVVKDDEYFRNLARQRIAAKTGSDLSDAEKESLPAKEQNRKAVVPTKPIQNQSEWLQIKPNVYARPQPRSTKKHPAWVQTPNLYVNPKTEKNRRTRLRSKISKMKKSGNLQTEQTNKTNLAPTIKKAQPKKKKKKGNQVANQIPTRLTGQNIPKPIQNIGANLPFVNNKIGKSGVTSYKNAVQPNFSGLNENRFEDQSSRKSMMENSTEFPTIVENRWERDNSFGEESRRVREVASPRGFASNISNNIGEEIRRVREVSIPRDIAENIPNYDHQAGFRRRSCSRSISRERTEFSRNYHDDNRYTLEGPSNPRFSPQHTAFRREAFSPIESDEEVLFEPSRESRISASIFSDHSRIEESRYPGEVRDSSPYIARDVSPDLRDQIKPRVKSSHMNERIGHGFSPSYPDEQRSSLEQENLRGSSFGRFSEHDMNQSSFSSHPAGRFVEDDLDRNHYDYAVDDRDIHPRDDFLDRPVQENMRKRRRSVSYDRVGPSHTIRESPVFCDSGDDRGFVYGEFQSPEKYRNDLNQREGHYEDDWDSHPDHGRNSRFDTRLGPSPSRNRKFSGDINDSRNRKYSGDFNDIRDENTDVWENQPNRNENLRNRERW